MAHTPGPLIVLEDEEGCIVDTPYEREGADGALAYVAYHDDALLYAAAPDLLAACEAALAWWDNVPKTIDHMNPPWLDQLRAAIAKAHGATDN